MNTEVMFSSATDLWATPQGFFDELHREFGFTLDVCALPDNAKCHAFYTPEQDGLSQPWNGIVWCNPPYGRDATGRWLAKAAAAAKSGSTVVCLVPARTCTRWFHDYCYQRPGVELRFVRGRLKFGGAINSAPFPSLVVVFRPA